VVFDSVHPRWSYVRLGWMVCARGGREATESAGTQRRCFYYFRKANNFIAAAMDMIRKNDHSGGNFFVCPTLNQMIPEASAGRGP